MARAIVLYDGDCGFCRWWLAKLLAWDRRGALRPVPLQDPEADRLLAGIDERERMASWHLVAGGELWSAGAALAPMVRLLPGGLPAAAALERLPRVTERTYRAVAGRRTTLGKLITSGMRRRADLRISSRRSGTASR
jgi:predicted DCC family thiol-disulfide oxidoreductase YuxK